MAESTATAPQATPPVEGIGAAPAPAPDAQQPAVDAQPPSPPAEPDPKQQRESARFAALARQQKALVEKQRAIAAEFRAKEEALAKREAEITERATKAERLERLRERAKLDPESVAKDLWGDSYYDFLTEAKLTGKVDPAVVARDLEEKFNRRFEEEEKKRQESARKAQEEQQAQLQGRMQQELQAFRQQTQEFVKAHADEYEITNLLDVSEFVPLVIEAHHAQTGRVMTKEEAAGLFETQLVERVMKSKKVRDALAKELAPKPAPTPPAAHPATLSNHLSAAPATAQPTRPQREDAVARAIRAMEQAEAARRQRSA